MTTEAGAAILDEIRDMQMLLDQAQGINQIRHTLLIFEYSVRPAIPHALRVRLQQFPSPMSDTRLRLLP